MTEATRYLQAGTQYALFIEWSQGKPREYARRFTDQDEAVAFGIELQVLTNRLLYIKVLPVEILTLKTWEGVNHEDVKAATGELDHFEALKDFAETHPGVPVVFDGPGLIRKDGSINEPPPCIACGAAVDEACAGDVNKCPRFQGSQVIDDEIPF